MARVETGLGRPLRIGLYSPYLGTTFGGGERYLLEAARALRDAYPQHAVEVSGAVPIDADRYQRVLGVDLAGIQLAASNRRVTPLHRALNSVTPLRPLRNAYIARQAARATARYDVFLGMIYRIPVANRAPRGVLLCQFPYPSSRALDGYQSVICQSEYVAGWVRRWWGREPAVVNPPIDVPPEAPSWELKQRSILAVGRFIGTGHVKRQDVLVEQFRALCDAGLDGWTLHLAGTVHRSGPHAGYFERVQTLARGYPVEFHPDADRTRLESLYARAPIFWHAAGYGADLTRHPEAAEHFGMTTAEAMAHGAVPVAIAAGGQLEVVADGRTGFLWRDVEQLRQRTLELAGDEALRRRLGEAARAASARWSVGEFRRRLLERVAPEIEAAAG